MRLYKTQLFKTISCVMIGISTLCSLTHSNDDTWQANAESMMRQQLKVQMVNNGNKSQINLVGIENDQLLFTLPGQSGEASMPLDSLGDVWFENGSNGNYGKAVGLLGGEQFTLKHLQIFRKKAYPRLRFIQIPRANCAFADSVRNFLEGLIQLHKYEEAIFLVDKLDISELGPDFEKPVIELASQLAKNEQEKAAISIIQKLSIEQIDATNLDFIIELAHSLRVQGNYLSAQDIYNKIAENPESSGNEAQYWAYYCGIHNGDYIDDHSFAETIITIEPGGDSFPLQQLILGIYYTKREQIKEAMRAISQGIAFAKPYEAWTPELMYRSAQIYKRIEMPEIAISVYKETILFFPSTKWAEAAQKEIN